MSQCTDCGNPAVTTKFCTQCGAPAGVSSAPGEVAGDSRASADPGTHSGSTAAYVMGRGAPASPIAVSAQHYPVVLPSRTSTVVITLFFGLFGLIPASIHTNRARNIGVSTNRYWAAFWTVFGIELGGTILFYVIVIAALSRY